MTEAKGNCFQQAFDLLVLGSYNNQSVPFYIGEPKLVHGIVWHEKTPYHVHGWVEDQMYCYDFIDGELKAVEKDRYYRIGRIKTGKDELKKYTAAQAKKLAVEKDKYYFSNLPCKV